MKLREIRDILEQRMLPGCWYGIGDMQEMTGADGAYVSQAITTWLNPNNRRLRTRANHDRRGREYRLLPRF